VTRRGDGDELEPTPRPPAPERDDHRTAVDHDGEPSSGEADQHHDAADQEIAQL